MRLSAADLYTRYRPSPCARRPWLADRADGPVEPGALEELLIARGRAHERAHLDELRAAGREVLDLSEVPRDARAAATRRALAGCADAIYQGRLEASRELGGATHVLVGEPDFLLREGDGYRVRDAKVATRITEADHPEILLQVALYAWLLEEVTGVPATGAEVLTAHGDRVPALPADPGALRAALEEIVALRAAPAEPEDPVGWSKCKGCVFEERCLAEAWARRDSALVSGVDQALARRLHGEGVTDARALLARHDEDSLADLTRPWGAQTRRVGEARAREILASARAIAADAPELLEPPGLPQVPDHVMFDLEGLPPHLGHGDLVYLWGMQVYGEHPGPYVFGLAGVGPEGDRAGWEQFLRRAGEILDRHGDLPFVHWASYERTKIEAYARRYGDPRGVAARVHANLLDAYRVARRAVALPLPSYSLKVLETYVGFERSQTEFGGDWSIAAWIEVLETEDPARRAELVDAVLTYNREDLAATWAVYDWLRRLG